ncbi:MAG: hypothetical protein JO309_10115 [Pseudonocardiales bacterium]|nr:hypothetical protein [Pseudonocardiales bacterium]
MHTRWQVNRMLGLLFWVGLLVLLAGLVWLAVVLFTQGVEQAGTWASVLSTGLAITGALITLATWWWRRVATRQFAGGQRPSEATNKAERTAPSNETGELAEETTSQRGLPVEQAEGSPGLQLSSVRRRALAIAGGVLVLAVVLISGVFLGREVVPSTVGQAVFGPPGPSRPGVGGIAPEQERRHGPLVLVPGRVADLDSLASDWGIQLAPGPAEADIEFGLADHALHGAQHASIAILPPGSIGTLTECAHEQNYGVTLAAANIRPGQLVCDITGENRVALLRIVDVQYDATAIPDQVTFDAAVRVQPHKS